MFISSSRTSERTGTHCDYDGFLTVWFTGGQSRKVELATRPTQVRVAFVGD